MSDYNGSSDLTQSILGSITQLGQTAILSNSKNPTVVTPTYARPVYSSPLVGTSSMSGGKILLFGLLLAGGYFAFKKL